MLYSSWNQAAGAYDYWETPGGGEPKVNVEKPTHLRPRELGSTVDQAAWPMPPGAVHIGQGVDAVGRITSPPDAITGLGDDGSSSALTGVLQLAAGVGVGLLAIRLLTKK